MRIISEITNMPQRGNPLQGTSCCVKVILQLCVNVAERSTHLRVFMCCWEAPTSGTFKWAAKQCCNHVLFVLQKKKNPARQMINKQTGLETDDVELAAAPR